MTQEEKAKAYDKALERAKALYSKGAPDSLHLEEMFPELAESKDEKIRKELLKFLESIWHLGKNAPLEKWDKSDCSKWIAWLEKQGEQKPLYINTPLINKMVNDYKNTDEYVDGDYKGKPVNCMVRAYRQGIKDTLSISKENPVKLKPAWSLII